MNCPLFYFWKVLLWRNTLIFLLLVVAPAWARSVDYEHRTLSRVLVHVVTVNLNDPQVKVTPFVAAGFPGTDEDFAALIARAQPTAAINGTFFGKQDLKPTGDIVIDGKLVNFGGMGTALAIDADNRVTFRRVPYGRHVDWAAKGYVSVLACGPSLILAGQVGVDPELEGFSDPHVLEAGPRSAVGITAYNKLKLVCVPAGVTLSRLASIMEQLGCVSAMNLDGGASTALYYRGKTIVAPG
ncbi:MAG TPA: phosphodiester glycosidase family protein, partial [Armatimonadetes bacterium]|nr:phosphodiester glycosidase family protein [Armatimonadota bacterium]